MNYGMLIDLKRCVGCCTCTMACKVQNGTLGDVWWSIVHTREVGEYPNSRIAVLPMACMHCQDAPCVKHCPTGASYQDDQGRVLIDSKKCIGCRMCQNACPYNARHFNFKTSEENLIWEGEELTPYEQIMKAKHPLDKVEKCDFCKTRIDEGHKPACVETCPAIARIFGDLDDPQSAVSIAIRQKQAVPFAEHFGTQPSVYYVGTF